MRLFLIAGVCFIAGLCSCKKSDQLTESEVIAVIKAFDDGWNHKNLAKVDSVLAPGYDYFTRSGGVFSRDSVVATAGENGYSLTDVLRSDFTVTIYGSSAVVSTRWRGKGMYRGQPFDEDQRCSVVVVKKNGKVMIASEHCTPIVATRVFH